MPIKIIYGVQGGPSSLEVRDPGTQHPHYSEEAVKTHHAITEAAA